MFEYFYNEILRRTIISFGTLFNNISIKHEDSSDNVVSVVKVPLAYGPTQKFLARLEQSPDLNKPFAITLPRMSFEFTGLTYDPTRKVTTTQTFTTREYSYSSLPRATKNYTGDAATTLSADLSITSKTFEVADGSTLTKGTYIAIDDEEMFIKSISGNKITVNRGQDGTQIETHVGGSAVHAINAADNALIEVGDDFGFSGTF
jgi:hypothetical protein